MRNLPPADLLTQLPPLQRLLERLMDCLPRGAAARHYVVQAALLTVAKESFQIYRAISEGIINLADCFFDMEYTDAQKGLEIYKQHTVDNDKLGVRCRNLCSSIYRLSKPCKSQERAWLQAARPGQRPERERRSLCCLRHPMR